MKKLNILNFFPICMARPQRPKVAYKVVFYLGVAEAK